jgi:hypothetical protein
MKQVNEIIYSAVKSQSILIQENKKLETLFSIVVFLTINSLKSNKLFSSNYLVTKFWKLKIN